MSRWGAPTTQPPKGRKRPWTGPHRANGREATASYWEKEEADRSARVQGACRTRTAGTSKRADPSSPRRLVGRARYTTLDGARFRVVHTFDDVG